MDPEEQDAMLMPSREELASVKVYPLIVHLKKDVMGRYCLELGLTASDVNFALVRPLVFKYSRLKNPAVVYAVLIVRSHFLSLASEDLAYSGVMISRANLCEIMAMKLLVPFASTEVGTAMVLTTSWSPLTGAPPNVVSEIRSHMGGEEDDLHDPQSALEMAIAGSAKTFMSAPLVQTVVHHIYTGRLVLSMVAHRSMLADNYKPRPLEIYDPGRAPFLDHYRLRVPRYGLILEFINFALLLVVFVLCLADRKTSHMEPTEIVFIVFALAFALEELTAAKEHGWQIYLASMWNVFDTAFIVVFVTYLGLRVHGLTTHNEATSELGFDILACGACILFPRLAFFAITNNIVVIALRGMIAEFTFFMGIAAVCFSGLLFTLWTLAAHRWTAGKIAWLMIQIWFGNTYLSFAQAESFHKIFGPILMTGFAALSNTLLLTILISILSNTFARINSNANQEYLFQFAIITIEGLKADALFSYQPPFNLLAFAILWPASFFLSARALHSANVFLIKVTSFPQLIMIGIYERYLRSHQVLRQSSKNAARTIYTHLPKQIKTMTLLEALMGAGVSDLYDAIFDVDFPEDPSLFGGSEDAENAPRRRVDSSTPGTPVSPTTPRRNGNSLSPHGRGRSPLPPLMEPSFSSDLPTLNSRSPLARLFARPPPSPSKLQGDGTSGLEQAVRRVEAALEEVRDLPVQRLRDEMKELQERQARIESMLMMLTRGMRNDTGPPGPSRQSTK